MTACAKQVAAEVAEQPASGERYFLESLDRGLSVLECFDEQHRERTLSEVAQAVGITRSTARRILLTLVDKGFLRLDGRNFSLTPRVLRFGFSYLAALRLPQVADPHIEALAKELGETISVTILDGPDVVYVARVRSPRIIRISITVGMRFPAYATSTGRVLLAGLSADALDDYLKTTEFQAFTPHTISDGEQLRAEVRKVAADGWSMSENELEIGIRGAAVPIRDRTGAVVAALNSSLQGTQYTRDDVAVSVVPKLVATAERIGSDLSLG